tara:strand:+ start:61 stop:627 length:567 start_codon:yes stop_codon:yes gene_type:complete
MNVALPILLLVFGGLTFWILNESKLKWYVKTACISAFCVFTIIFWTTIHTFLGWPAEKEDAPEVVIVHWAVVKEPDKLTDFQGAIYFLLESAKSKEKSFFGYRSSGPEPRLFGFPYSRELHEQVEAIKGKIKKGQPVVGKLEKSPEDGKGKKGNNKESTKKGGGSESQNQDWHFHELRPSDFLHKPKR